MTSDSSTLDYLNLAWRRKWYVLGPALAGVAIAYAVYRSLPPVYDARATVIDEREVSRYDENRAKSAWDNPRTGLERLMRSDFAIPVARRISETPPGGRLDPGLLGRVRKTLRYEVVGNLLYFRGRGSDPVFVTKVANAYAQQFVDSTTSRKVSKSDQYASFYESQLADKKAELEAAEKRMVQFAASHRGSLPEDAQTHANASGQLRSQLGQAEADLQSRRDERETFITTLSQTPDPTLLTDRPKATDVNDPGVRLRMLEVELADLRTRLTDRHPDVQQKLRDVEALRATVAAMPPPLVPSSPGRPAGPLDPARIGLANYQKLLSLDREVARLERRAGALRGDISRHDGAMSSAGQNSVQWTSLTRARDNLQAEYNSLLGNAQKADLTQDMNATAGLQTEYRILELADVPKRPAGPLLLALLSIGLGAGFAIGAGIVVVMEMLDQTYRTSEELVKDLGVPVIATIVRIEEARHAPDHVGRRRQAV